MPRRQLNLCTEVVHTDPEIWGTNGVSQAFDCVKGAGTVLACAFYRPMTYGDGTPCPYECAFFDNGCTCKAARTAAHKRTERILRKLLAKQK